MDEDVARFWREFEAETGERVEAKAVGELCDGGAREAWFLLVLTDRSFWFKEVPSENWIQTLFGSRPLSASSRRADTYTLRIPREDILSLEEPDKGPHRWFSRPAFPQLVLAWREGEDVRRRSFSVDPSMDLLPRLRSAFGPKA